MAKSPEVARVRPLGEGLEWIVGTHVNGGVAFVVVRVVGGIEEVAFVVSIPAEELVFLAVVEDVVGV